MKILEVWGTALQDIDFDESHWLQGEDSYHSLSARRVNRGHQNYVCLLTKGKRSSAVSYGVQYEFFPVDTVSDARPGSLAMLDYIRYTAPEIILLHSLNAYQSALCLQNRLPEVKYIMDSNSAATSGTAIDYIASQPDMLDGCIFKTPAIRSTFCEVTGFPLEQTTVIPSGIDTTFFKPSKVEKDLDCISVGYWRQNNWRKKNISLLMDVFAELDYSLHIVGNGSMFDKLKSLAPSNVFCTGYVTHHDLVVLLNRSKVFIHPALFDPAPRAVSEALACGLPVIGLQEGFGTEQQIFDGVNGFRVESVTAMRDAITCLLSDASSCQRMGQASRQIARKSFNIDLIASQLEQFLEARYEAPINY